MCIRDSADFFIAGRPGDAGIEQAILRAVRRKRLGGELNGRTGDDLLAILSAGDLDRMDFLGGEHGDAARGDQALEIRRFHRYPGLTFGDGGNVVALYGDDLRVGLGERAPDKVRGASGERRLKGVGLPGVERQFRGDALDAVHAHIHGDAGFDIGIRGAGCGDGDLAHREGRDQAVLNIGDIPVGAIPDDLLRDVFRAAVFIQHGGRELNFIVPARLNSSEDM